MFEMSIVMYLQLYVKTTLFHNFFDVTRSIVCIVSSPGYVNKFPPAVIWTLLGSSFCG